VKTPYLEFQQFCRDTFSSPEIGDAVYKFYRAHILFTPSQKAQFQKNLTRVRTGHIANLLAEFNEDSIISIINYFIDKANKGEVVEIQSVYFYTCVKNNYIAANPISVKKSNLKPIKKEQRIEKVKTIANSQIVIPILMKQLTKTLKEDQRIEEQFLYKCPMCSNKIIGQLDECNVCKNILDYTSIDYSGASK